MDFDLHHGDGSQSIAWTLNEIASSNSTSTKKTAGIHVPQIGYFSLHDINSYPCEVGDMEKVKNASLNLEAHGQFIHNIHLKPYHSIDEFWDLYENKYSSIISKAREFLSTAAVSKPKKGREFKAGVFLSAGFDASEYESSGMQRHSVNVPTSFYARFTSDALALAEQYCGGRVLSVLEGGYSDRALMTGVFAHLAGLACPSPTTVSGFVPSSVGLMPVPEPYATRPSSADRGWDPEWWGIERIAELERYYEKMTAKKIITDKPSTSYLSATAASAARAESPRRALSSSSLGGAPMPPPVIPWEVQAFDLSRRIIPEFDESVEIPALDKSALQKGNKGKRHSVAGAADPGARMTLRDRKPKAIPDPSPALDVRRRRTTTGAMSTATSRAPSRAQTPAVPSTRGPTPMPQSRGSTPAPGVSAGGRRITSSGSGVSVAGPRTLTKKPSVIGNSINAQRSPQHGLHRKPSTATLDGTKNATSPSSAGSSAGSTNGGVSPGTIQPKDLDEAFVNKFQKVKITYKNREKDEEVLRMERQKEELEKRLEVEKRRLANGGSRVAPKKSSVGPRSTSAAGNGVVNGSMRARSVSSASVHAQVNGHSQVNGQVNGGAGGHAEKETKMVITPPPTGQNSESSAQVVDNTYRGGNIKFASMDPKPGPGPGGLMGRMG